MEEQEQFLFINLQLMFLIIQSTQQIYFL
ncbi:UNVERIFIED_CONTAM: hypothetical protein GTU68_060673 [Idotea baltica]|nr:hypothetical protein [Idotea baltica]